MIYVQGTYNPGGKGKKGNGIIFADIINKIDSIKEKEIIEKAVMSSIITIVTIAFIHSKKPMVLPAVSFSMAIASGFLAPPRKVATPPMMAPHASDMKRAFA